MFSGEVEKQLEGPMLLEVGLGLFQYVTVDSVGVPLCYLCFWSSKPKSSSAVALLVLGMRAEIQKQYLTRSCHV